MLSKSLSALTVLLSAMCVAAQVFVTGYAGADCTGLAINAVGYPDNAGESASVSTPPNDS